MKRLMLYGLLIALVWVVPTERVDVAELQPIEVIAIYKQGDSVVVSTDTEDTGSGHNAVEALENMQATAPAVIYLDTAEYLLIGPGAEEEVERVRHTLKKRVKLCTVDGPIDLKQAAQFLNVHGNLPELWQWKAGEKLSFIISWDGRIKLLKNIENDS